MQIRALVENDRLTGRPDLQAAWGLSLHVETRDGLQILFDTGPSDVLLHNAAAMNVDLAAVDVGVLSHHHFDHAGGLAAFLGVNSRATVHLRAGEMTERWFRALRLVKRSIGLDLELMERERARFSFVSDKTEIAPEVFVLTEIGDAYARPRGNSHLFVRQGDRETLDPFDHELVMVIREEDGIVVFSGCSHHGILNMVKAAADAFPELPVKGVFGGFHLVGIPIINTMAGSRAEVRDIGAEMAKLVSGEIYSCHCTGPRAFKVLRDVVGERLRPLPTGSVCAI